MTTNELREAVRNLDDTINALFEEVADMTDYALKAQLLKALNISSISMIEIFRLAFSDEKE